MKMDKDVMRRDGNETTKEEGLQRGTEIVKRDVNSTKRMNEADVAVSQCRRSCCEPSRRLIIDDKVRFDHIDDSLFFFPFSV